MTTRPHVKPSYVWRGSCGDCLKVWGRDRDALLKKIRLLERENEELRQQLARQT